MFVIRSTRQCDEVAILRPQMAVSKLHSAIELALTITRMPDADTLPEVLAQLLGPRSLQQIGKEPASIGSWGRIPELRLRK